jgi:Zn-dependent protease with chaperone function
MLLGAFLLGGETGTAFTHCRSHSLAGFAPANDCNSKLVERAAMEFEKFEALVRKCEVEAKANPNQYQFKVRLLALLGSSYVILVMLALAALLPILISNLQYSAGFFGKLTILVGGLLWLLLKALNIKLALPVGYRVTPETVPDLFRMLDQLCAELGSPRPHQVLITNQMNASVVQVPRLGMLGWDRSYLLLGLPMMNVLTEEQFKSVLAHEFGHLAMSHARIANRIYCQRLRWSNLMEAVEANSGLGTVLFSPFLNWFAPYFNAFTFPLARANEYEADRASIRLASSRAAADSLTIIHIVARFLDERFWPRIFQLADSQPTPPCGPFSGMRNAIALQLDAALATELLRQEMSRQTDLADTHPALSDRLSVIGLKPVLELPSSSPGAERLLGTELDSIADHFDTCWLADIQLSWRNRYEAVREKRNQLAVLNSQVASGTELLVEDALTRAALTAWLDEDPDSARVQYGRLYELVPGDSTVCFRYGEFLLDRNDESGVAVIERAIQSNAALGESGCEIIRNYYLRVGLTSLAQSWHDRLVDHWQHSQQVVAENSDAIDRAVDRASWMVTWPSLGCLLSPLIVYFVLGAVGALPTVGYEGLPWFAGFFTLGIVGGWLSWAILVPRWRLWAYGQVEDIEELKRRAVADKVIWPTGHFLERT